MSPEQIRGSGISSKSDIYSMGCVVYYCFTKQTPFSGSGFTVAAAHLSDPPPAIRSRVPSLPAEVESVINRCLEKDPGARYEDASELGNALFDALEPIFDMPMSEIWPASAYSPDSQIIPTALENPDSSNEATLPSHAENTVPEATTPTGPGKQQLRTNDKIPVAKAPPSVTNARKVARGGTGTNIAELSDATIPYAGPVGEAPAAPVEAPNNNKALIAAAIAVPIILIFVGGLVVLMKPKAEPAPPQPMPTTIAGVVATPGTATVPAVQPTQAPQVAPTPSPAPSPTPDELLARVKRRERQFENGDFAERIRVYAETITDPQFASAPRMRDLADKFARQIALNPPMVKLEEGRYNIGASDREFTLVKIADERPSHSVTLGAYEVAKYEVTATEFSAFINDKKLAGRLSAGWFKDPLINFQRDEYTQRVTPKPNRESNPANGIDWELANEYAQWLSDQTQQQWSLPTEAEWEVAAKARTTQMFPWGDQEPSSDQANYNTSSTGTVSVFDLSNARNNLDLRHMAGNVQEWCGDWFSDSTYQTAGPGTANPRGPASKPSGSARRVLRGGSFESQKALELRASRRHREEPDANYSDLGFRVVRRLR